MFDRRQFLIGAAGSLLTATFVRKAKGFSVRNREPLLTPPVRKAEETLFLYSSYNDCSDHCKWRVSLGPDVECPPPQTWREHLASLGVPLGTEEDVRRACAERGMEPEELATEVDGYSWQDRWDNVTGPQAKAFHLLESIDLGPTDSPLRREGNIFFEAMGGAPGNSYTWVDFKDDLTASLMQQRLIELGLPIHVAVGRPF